MNIEIKERFMEAWGKYFTGSELLIFGIRAKR